MRGGTGTAYDQAARRGVTTDPAVAVKLLAAYGWCLASSQPRRAHRCPAERTECVGRAASQVAATGLDSAEQSGKTPLTDLKVPSGRIFAVSDTNRVQEGRQLYTITATTVAVAALSPTRARGIAHSSSMISVIRLAVSSMGRATDLITSNIRRARATWSGERIMRSKPTGPST